jgi:chlorobactene glucosyltransferase
MQLEDVYLTMQAVLAFFAAVNVLFWRTLHPTVAARLALSSSPPMHSSRISLLVPARDEAQNLERLLPSLLRNTDPSLEILILNDRSEDATASVAQRFAATDSRVRVLEGLALPEGWLGKNWACHQLALEATGDVLIFTDADTKWVAGASRAIARELETCDALCAWPAQVVVDPVSRLIQPLQQWSLVALLPLFFVPVRAFPIAVAANGQCLAFTRAMYERVGGHAAVRREVLEDMALARGVKRSGGRFRLLNGALAVETRMYSSAREALAGYVKNVYPAFGGTPVGFLAATLFNLLVYVLPWVWWLVSGRLEAGLCVLLSLVARGLSDWRSGYDLRFTALHPLGVLLWAYIGLISWRRFNTGKVVWKGRAYDLR